MTDMEFPPYGIFSRAYLDQLDPTRVAPPRWLPDHDPTSREAEWLTWREQTLALIASTLWPLWDESSRSWIDPDRDRMLALTLADFDLLDILESRRMLARKPDSPIASPDLTNHRSFFEDEDTGKPGVRYGLYDPTLEPEVLSRFTADFHTADVIYEGSISLQFKMQIRRPRPYQTAMMLGRAFGHEKAVTSMTASMSSGHCLQGCMLTAGTYDLWLERGFHPTREQCQALAQFAVDQGDRRVFAGVHYPSDNMASWIIALRVLPHVYTHKAEVSALIVDAVLNRSAVYRLLKAENREPHRPALAVIDQLIGELPT